MPFAQFSLYSPRPQHTSVRLLCFITLILRAIKLTSCVPEIHLNSGDEIYSFFFFLN